MSAIHAGRRRWLAAAGGAVLFAPWKAWAQTAAPVPRRVVVIGGALAECVYALGMERVLVAADTTCTYPRPVLALPKVGYLRTLSAEGVLSLRPDLVLMSTDAGPPEALAQLRGSGVRIAAIAERHDARTARGKIVEVARLLGAQSAATRVLAAFDAAMQTTERQVAARRARQAPVRAAFLLGHAGMQTMVAGRDTAADAMLRYAGASNVFGDDGRHGFKGYKPLTAESMIAAAPDVLVSTLDAVEAAGGTAAFLSASGLAATPAARHRRLVAMDTLYLLGFGPRLPQAIDALSRQLAEARA